MFDLLGAEPQDTFEDLYPGSGGIGRAWSLFASCPAGERVARIRTLRVASAGAHDASLAARADASGGLW
jgi:hypothetical protein